MNELNTDVGYSSALQLYHAAYRLHYEANDLKEASRLYREILRQFPESHECGYAVVQLEKIGAGEVMKMLGKTSLQQALPVVALLMSLIALIIACCALFLALNQNNATGYRYSTESYYALADGFSASANSSDGSFL